MSEQHCVSISVTCEKRIWCDHSREITLDDIERVLAAADGDGNSISVICIALSTYKKLRQTQGAKELAATYRADFRQ